jgi:uncharacterized protein
MKHLINWVEIPVTEIKRAVHFYTAVLGIEFQEMEMQGNKYALFPAEDKYNAGALVQGAYYRPSADGIAVYLDGGNDLSTILSKVQAAGGQVMMEKMFVSPEAGYIGMFIDSEGNRIGLQHM